jgi:hypothetical protein
MPSPLAGSRAKPSCGHARPSECPLTYEDWYAIWMAYLGFLAMCRYVSEKAHARAARSEGEK